MSQAMTYNSLVEDIKNYCERSDDPFISQIPRFIMLAEVRISSEKKPFGLIRTVTGSLNGNVLDKPERWRRTKQFSISVNGRRIPLKQRGYEYCRSYWPDTSVTDIVKYYSDYDFEHFFLVPTPAAQYSFELQYYERPKPLDENNQTNWLTQYAPQALLYATLLEAMPFLKTQERIAEFQGLYDRAIGAIANEDQERLTDNSSTRG